MTKDELIAKQQMEIEMLKQLNTNFLESDNAIYKILHCIGGPLNDNKLGYTKEQLDPFFRIRDWLQ